MLYRVPTYNDYSSLISDLGKDAYSAFKMALHLTLLIYQKIYAITSTKSNNDTNCFIFYSYFVIVHQVNVN